MRLIIDIIKFLFSTNKDYDPYHNEDYKLSEEKMAEFGTNKGQQYSPPPEELLNIEPAEEIENIEPAEEIEN